MNKIHIKILFGCDTSIQQLPFVKSLDAFTESLTVSNFKEGIYYTGQDFYYAKDTLLQPNDC